MSEISSPSAAVPSAPRSPKRFQARVGGAADNRVFQITYLGRNSQETIVLDKPTALHHWIQRGLIREPPSFSLVHLDKGRLGGVFVEGEKILLDSPGAVERLEEIFQELVPKEAAAQTPGAKAGAATPISLSTTVGYIRVKRVGFSFKLVFDTTFTKDHEMTLEEGMKYLEDHNVLRPFVLVKVSTHLKAHEQHQDAYREVEGGTIDLNTANEKQVEEFFNRFLPAGVGGAKHRRKHDPRLAEWLQYEDPPPGFSVADDRGGHLILACHAGKTLKFDLALTAFNAKRLLADVASIVPTLQVTLSPPRVAVEDHGPGQAAPRAEFDLSDAHRAQAFAAYLNERVRIYLAWGKTLLTQLENDTSPASTPGGDSVQAPTSVPSPAVANPLEPASPLRPSGAAASPPPPPPPPPPTAGKPNSAPAAAEPNPPPATPPQAPLAPEPDAALAARFHRAEGLADWPGTNRGIFQSLAAHLDIPVVEDAQGYRLVPLSEVVDKSLPDFSGFVLAPSGCFIFSCWGDYVRFGATVSLRSAQEAELFEYPSPALLGVAVHGVEGNEELALVIADELGKRLEQGLGKRMKEHVKGFVRLLTARELSSSGEAFQIGWPLPPEQAPPA